LKLGAVGYLNAEPLIWPIENGSIDNSHEIIRAVPSDLAAMLVNGEIDCALAPVVTLLENPDLVPIPGVAIACRGPVASVIVFHNDFFDELKKIWLDPSSRTSNLLVRILRGRVSFNPCEFTMPSSGEVPHVAEVPAFTGRLIIGDEALRLSSAGGHGVHETDLGELWREKFTHPFTFARWIARNGDIAGELTGQLQDARDWSMLNMHEIVGPLSEKYGFPQDLVDRYLRVNITYMHGPREQTGEREFFTLAGNLKD